MLERGNLVGLVHRKTVGKEDPAREMTSNDPIKTLRFRIVTGGEGGLGTFPHHKRERQRRRTLDCKRGRRLQKRKASS